MEIILGYFAGILTLINPCILPVLPIALASSISGHKHGPLALTLGLSITFTMVGVLVTAFGTSIGLNIDQLSSIGAIFMIIFGVILIVPFFSDTFTKATSGLASSADQKIDHIGNKGMLAQFLGGMLLGIVWSPCIGPTLGGAISLAAQGQSLLFAAAIMLSFSLGVSTIILALAYGARSTILARQARMRQIAEKSKLIMGIVFIAIGLMIYFKFHYYLEEALLNAMPIWLQDLSIKF